MKTSELPAGVVIDIAGKSNTYEKNEDGRWFATTGHCVDCMDDDFLTSEQVDTHHYIIESVPYGVVWQMAILLGEEYGSTDAEGEPITYEDLIDQAMEIHKAVEAREAAANN